MSNTLSISIKGKLLEFIRPVVMGIVNASPDSFYSGGRMKSDVELLKSAEKHIAEGASFIDIGAVSTRPGAVKISFDEEIQRLIPQLNRIRMTFPEIYISIDTTNARVAQAAIDEGADIINDISAGDADDKMFETIVKNGITYCIMHKQGEPMTMQSNPQYGNVVVDVMKYLARKVHHLQSIGVSNLIIDPGFGFGKTVDHNYLLLKNLAYFKHLNLPILIGISRKSMINKVLKISPDDALNGTTALHMLAIQGGANILRVHDVKECVQAIALFEYFENQSPIDLDTIPPTDS